MRGRLLTMATEIVPYHMAHNAEAEGCDLLMEIERLDLLQDFVDESAYQRVCLYLTRYIHSPPEDGANIAVKQAYNIYNTCCERKFQHPYYML